MNTKLIILCLMLLSFNVQAQTVKGNRAVAAALIEQATACNEMIAGRIAATNLSIGKVKSITFTGSMKTVASKMEPVIHSEVIFSSGAVATCTAGFNEVFAAKVVFAIGTSTYSPNTDEWSSF